MQVCKMALTHNPDFNVKYVYHEELFNKENEIPINTDALHKYIQDLGVEFLYIELVEKV